MMIIFDKKIKKNETNFPEITNVNKVDKKESPRWGKRNKYFMYFVQHLFEDTKTVQMVFFLSFMFYI